jgi:hypothetical protein
MFDLIISQISLTYIHNGFGSFYPTIEKIISYCLFGTTLSASLRCISNHFFVLNFLWQYWHLNFSSLILPSSHYIYKEKKIGAKRSFYCLVTVFFTRYVLGIACCLPELSLIMVVNRVTFSTLPV